MHKLVWERQEVGSLHGMLATARVADCVNLCHEFHTQRGHGSIPLSLATDVSQDVDRKPWGTEALPTFTTSSEILCFKKQRTMCGAEYLAALGFAVDNLALPASHNALKDMAGDAFALPAVGAVVAACVAAVRGAQPP